MIGLFTGEGELVLVPKINVFTYVRKYAEEDQIVVLTRKDFVPFSQNTVEDEEVLRPFSTSVENGNTFSWPDAK